MSCHDAPTSPDSGTVQGGPPACEGNVLFGRPSSSTGLTDAQCQPRCTCSGRIWEAPVYTDGQIASWSNDWTLATPLQAPSSDPYAVSPPPVADAKSVCGVLPEQPGSRVYRLVTYASTSAAGAAGAMVTHFGACGLCSTLKDLAVYASQNDLTAPVRDCALKATESEQMQCLLALGFTYPCARIWYYDTLNTKKQCSAICIAQLGAPYNNPDGSINACLQCDEDQSGPVFKAVAGRTRRDTGLPNAMCRPCSEVKPLVHAYP